MQADQFERIFDAWPGGALVLRPDLTICGVNDAYLRATMRRRSELLGRDLFDAFPSVPDGESDPAAKVRASMRHVLLEKRAHRIPMLRYPVRRPTELGGELEERYWCTVNTPVLGPDGQVELILHTVEDMTEVVQLQRDKQQQTRDLDEVTARSQRFVDLLDSAPDAVVITGQDGIIQLVNMQTEKLFGYRREELLGQRLELLVPERFRRGHAEHVSRYFANAGTRPMGSGLQLFGRRKDGSEIPIEVSLSPHRRGSTISVSAAIRDISERMRLEAAARLNADRLASAVDSIQDAFALFDAEDRLILCNSVYRRLLHTSVPGTLIGKTFRELLEEWTREMDFPDEAARIRWRDERLARRRQEHTGAFDVRLLDGRRMRVSDRQTAEGGIVKTIWDLTDEERRAEELREARAAAEAASEAKSEFLASMSHELRTPLNAILGFAQLLQRDRREPLSERHRERVGHILTGGEHLLRLIDDVLDLARIEAGRVSVFTEAVELAPMLEEIRKTLEPIATRYKVTLVVEGGDEPLPRMLVDRTRFAQILINLGSNAIKYNKPGGTVRFRCARLDVSRWRITVEDDGVGIPYDKQSKLFQPFQRAGQETGPVEGTGIGLVITRRLAALMGGDVGFRSVPDQGSAFWVDIPIEQAPEPGRGGQAELPATAGAAVLSEASASRLVLYVEDNPANVTFMRDLMSSFESVDLLTAPTAEIGIELARARRPAAIIMDINLPGMSGLDALRALRAQAETQHIPVIALTAAASERDRQLGMKEGFFRYLTKPVRVDELLEALETLLVGS